MTCRFAFLRWAGAAACHAAAAGCWIGWLRRRLAAAAAAAAGRPAAAARRGGGSSGARLGAVARVRARNKATDDRLQPCCSERRCQTVALAAPRPLLLSMAAGAAAALSLLLLLLLLLRPTVAAAAGVR
jgi:hypothetical protein